MSSCKVLSCLISWKLKINTLFILNNLNEIFPNQHKFTSAHKQGASNYIIIIKSFPLFGRRVQSKMQQYCMPMRSGPASAHSIPINIFTSDTVNGGKNVYNRANHQTQRVPKEDTHATGRWLHNLSRHFCSILCKKNRLWIICELSSVQLT